MKSYQLYGATLLLVVLLYGCTFTQRYQPSFNDKKAATIDSLKTRYGFEDIEFVAKKVSKGDKKSVSLSVKFINGKSIPTDTNQMVALEKNLGSQMKNIVKDPKEFDTYFIILDKRVVKGSVTHDDYTGYGFNSDEL